MKTLIKIFALTLFITFVSHGLVYGHGVLWEREYDKCKAELISQKNYESVRQAADCASRPVLIRVLGTLVWRDGSYL